MRRQGGGLVRQLALGLTVGLASCGGSKPSTCNEQEQLGLTFVPNAQLNHDRDGYARSVVLRVLQLDDTAAFEEADFETLWESGAVQGAVAGRDEVTLVPGRAQTQQLKRSPKATHLGIAANFRQHEDEAAWKALVQLPPPQDPCNPDEELKPFKLELELANYSMHVR